MLFTSLLCLAAAQSDVIAIENRFRQFCLSHKVLSVDCAISGWGGAANATLVVHRVGTDIKVDWQTKAPNGAFRYTTNGRMSIEVDSTSRIYDRLISVNHPVPGGRVRDIFGYPLSVVAGVLPFMHQEKGAKLAKKGNLVEITLLLHGLQADTLFTADLAEDGSLASIDVAKGTAPNWKHEHIDFHDYRFGSAALASTFNIDPPIGYSSYAFDPTPDILGTSAPIPAVVVTGPSHTTLAAIAKHKNVLLVFVDDPMPTGLVASLQHLGAKVPVVAIALRGSEVQVDKVPLYRTDEAGFDQAGVKATPQFYCVKSGKVAQAWSGFKKSEAASFEAAVQAAFAAP